MYRYVFKFRRLRSFEDKISNIIFVYSTIRKIGGTLNCSLNSAFLFLSHVRHEYISESVV